MNAGATLVVPELPGRWSVWSKADDCPGAHFVVPCTEEAYAAGVKWAVVKITQVKGDRELIELVRVEKAAS